MTVNVRHKNGIRHGDFEIHGVRGQFPVQAITSTNLNHAKFLGVPNFNFRTEFLEIIEKFPNRILTEYEYRQKRISEISKIISQNPDKLCLLVLNGARTIKI